MNADERRSERWIGICVHLRLIVCLRIEMLRHTLLHPRILEVLARAGHHARVLIADGNYPASSALGPNAELVSLQLMPGMPTVDQVLQALLSAKSFEAANTMGYETTAPSPLPEAPPVWADFKRTITAAKLPLALKLEPIE